MVFRNTLFRRQVAKHRALVLIVSAHTTKTFGNVLMSRGNLLFQQRLSGGALLCLSVHLFLGSALLKMPRAHPRIRNSKPVTLNATYTAVAAGCRFTWAYSFSRSPRT